MAVIELNDKNFEGEVIGSSLPVLVDFFAEWCGPCKLAAPVLEEIAGVYDGKVKVGKVNVDESALLASKHEVMSIPTVVMFVKGKEVDRQTGFGGRDAYESMVKKAIGG